jgi:hypothetical protein
VEAVTGHAARLVEMELIDRGLVAPLPGQHPVVIPKERVATELHKAASCGDVRGFATLAIGPEYINGRDPRVVTPLWNDRGDEGIRIARRGRECLEMRWSPVYVAECRGDLDMVMALVSFGTDVSVPDERIERLRFARRRRMVTWKL